MGQRLNIEIIERRAESEEDEVVLANAYYHWSAYTRPANELVADIISRLDKWNIPFDEIEDKRLYAIRLLEATGARVAPEEHAEITKLYPDFIFEQAINRNDGLIAFTEDEINSTRKWEEGRMTVFLEDQTVEANCHFEYDTIEECLQHLHLAPEQVEEIKNLDCAEFASNTKEMSFDDFGLFYQACETAKNYLFKMKDGTIVSLIA